MTTRLLTGALTAALGQAALCQPTVSPRELLAENERLVDENREARELIELLQGELTLLRNERRGLLARVGNAEQVLRALRRELEAATGEPISEVDRQIAQTPDDALASPASLLRELRSLYFESLPPGTDGSPAQLDEYKQRVQLWCRLTNRELRGKRTWLVELADLIPLRGGRAVARLTVIDEASGLPIAEAVDVEIPRQFIDRVENDPRYERWLLTSIVIASPRYNDGRATRGVFEYPPFVGPYVDFDFELDWISLRGWRADRLGTGAQNDETDDPGEDPAD
ncbi:MAG: hypothetical protein AAFR96_09770 [Planctomycetota bacterium]